MASNNTNNFSLPFTHHPASLIQVSHLQRRTRMELSYKVYYYSIFDIDSRKTDFISSDNLKENYDILLQSLQANHKRESL